MNALSQATIEPYTLLRAALSLFKRPPTDLEAEQLLQVQRQARNEYEIESRVINSPEAAGVIVTEQELAQAVAEVRNRFDTEEAFTAALEANNLSLPAPKTNCNLTTKLKTFQMHKQIVYENIMNHHTLLP